LAIHSVETKNMGTWYSPSYSELFGGEEGYSRARLLQARSLRHYIALNPVDSTRKGILSSTNMGNTMWHEMFNARDSSWMSMSFVTQDKTFKLDTKTPDLHIISARSLPDYMARYAEIKEIVYNFGRQTLNVIGKEQETGAVFQLRVTLSREMSKYHSSLDTVQIRSDNGRVRLFQFPVPAHIFWIRFMTERMDFDVQGFIIYMGCLRIHPSTPCTFTSLEDTNGCYMAWSWPLYYIDLRMNKHLAIMMPAVRILLVGLKKDSGINVEIRLFFQETIGMHPIYVLCLTRDAPGKHSYVNGKRIPALDLIESWFIGSALLKEKTDENKVDPTYDHTYVYKAEPEQKSTNATATAASYDISQYGSYPEPVKSIDIQDSPTSPVTPPSPPRSLQPEASTTSRRKKHRGSDDEKDEDYTPPKKKSGRK